MLDNLTDKMHAVIKRVRGNAKLTEENLSEVLREIRVALLEADVALPVVKEFCSAIKDEAVGRDVLHSLSPAQEFIGIAQRQLVELLGGDTEPNLRVPAPARIMMVGLQGTGKTTSCGKLARLLKLRYGKKRILVASCDMQRPAAHEQLALLCSQAGVDFLDGLLGKTPEAVAAMAVDRAQKGHYDAVILDTAGRVSVDEELMAELALVAKTFAPNETLLVIDAMSGQAALSVCESFKRHAPISGIIATKMDGDSRGGAVLSAKKSVGVPVKFSGVSEKIDGLEPFNPERVAGRILGMGDVVSLVEKAYEARDEEDSKKLEAKFKKGSPFDLEDFLAQIRQMRRMGGIGSFMDKLPREMAMMAASAPAGVTDEKALARMEGMILSMTPKERRDPAIIKATRKKRIAAGAGVQVQDVNRLIKQWETIEMMMKKLRGGGLAKLMKMAGNFSGRR